MLTRVVVNSDLDLNLSVPEIDTDLVQLKNITGLGPVAATVNTTPFGLIDGEIYNGSTVGKRNIVMTFGLNPDWLDQTMSSLRHLLYTYFMPKSSVDLQFLSDDLPTVGIQGYVETFEPNTFTKDPEIQVSIICPLPDFVGINPNIQTGLVGSSAPNGLYAGNVRTGFVFELTGTVAVPTYTGPARIRDITSSASDIVADVTIDAAHYYSMGIVPGEKYFEMRPIAGGPGVSILRVVTFGDYYPYLTPGTVDFGFLMDAPLDPDALDGLTWTFTYFDRFGGI